MEAVKSKTKKHKKHKHSTNGDDVERGNKPIENAEKLLKKKKKKDAHRDIETLEDTSLIGLDTLENNTFGNKRKFSEVENGNEEVQVKKKKKSKTLKESLDGESSNQLNESKISSENMGKSLELEEHSSGIKKTKKKKKHKKKRTKCDTDLENHATDVMGSIDAIKSIDGKNDTLQENTDGEKLTKQQKKEKKRKKKLSEKLEEVVSEKEARVENILGTKSSTVVKKHKKKNKRERNETSELTETCNEEVEDGPEKQVCENVENVCNVLTANKTIIGKSNMDETTNATVDVTTGQWSGVNLGDSNRQNKFFKLLGGFKKGSDTSQIQNRFSLGKKAGFGLNSNSGMKSGGGFAMDKKQEDVYTKSLENEYERAMSMNLNRGIGLGFEKAPDAGKKFYIDTKSSKSVKFDD